MAQQLYTVEVHLHHDWTVEGEKRAKMLEALEPLARCLDQTPEALIDELTSEGKQDVDADEANEVIRALTVTTETTCIVDLDAGNSEFTSIVAVCQGNRYAQREFATDEFGTRYGLVGVDANYEGFPSVELADNDLGDWEEFSALAKEVTEAIRAAEPKAARS